MLKNYLIVAIRTLIRNRNTSLINIVGLAIGLASCILIFIYVRTELSYDRFHPESEKLFRVLTIDKALGVTSNLVGITLPALGPAMAAEIPEVTQTVRVNGGGRGLITYEGESLYAEDVKFVEPAFLDFFGFEWKKGEKKQALTRPHTGVISESLAKKIFGEKDPIGETLELNSNTKVEITGILADPPSTTHLDYELLVSLYPTEQDSNLIQTLQSWQQISMITYVALSAPANETLVESKMEEIIRKNDVGENFSVILQPIEEVHLYSSDVLFDGYNENKTDAGYVYALLVVALFIILIAAFNFMNLSTARSSNRAREVGMRKVLGAFRQQLIAQFLGESVLLCLIALVLALGLASLVVEISDLPFGIDPLGYLFTDTPLLLGLIGGTVLLGLMAGSYPAFLLSGFEPVKVLKGKFMNTLSGIWLRRILVVVQFTASIVMIIGTMVVYRQLEMVKNRDKGFDPEQIITLNIGNPAIRTKYEALKNELSQHPHIKGFACSSSMPGRGFGRNGIQPEGVSEEDIWIVSIMGMNEDYIPLMGMEMAAGRNFSKEFSTDSIQATIINEALADALGWGEEAVGRTINFGPTRTTVVGVVKNFHFASMRHQIEPMIMYYQPGALNVLSVKMDAEDISGTLDHVQKTWEKINPAFPYEYLFFDEDFAQQFRSEETFARLIVFFTGLAIFISCLGLLGLSAFSAEQRTREIGIRKVLGASVMQVVGLLSREFTILVAIAAVIAVPVAWFAMNSWLESFAYRISIGWGVFVLSGLLALAIALLTNAWHAVKTATANPTEALRYE
ncbi:MAG: ABC transporter permease [Bacteroidia bacterium]|nr:ABC transporter permease [Bacteroidia bacterium]